MVRPPIVSHIGRSGRFAPGDEAESLDDRIMDRFDTREFHSPSNTGTRLRIGDFRGVDGSEGRARSVPSI
jgi:hypothetical protein